MMENEKKIIQHPPELIKRSQINMADYNPRKITPEAKQKLRTNLEARGVMGGIVWNTVTGNLVAGHQRLKIMDKDNKYRADDPKTDYDIWVTKVELTEQEEKEQNIFLNNPSAMGFFDNEKLKVLMNNINFSEVTGFSKKDQISILGTTELTDKEYEKIAVAVSEQTSQYRAMSKNRGSEVDGFYIVLVFKNHNEKDMLCNNFGITLDEGRFIEGNTFVQAIFEQAEMEKE
jgi:hypothetical protein